MPFFSGNLPPLVVTAYVCVTDLFYTRVMPSKMFDVLKEDFDYVFISSVLLGMIAVSLISQKLAARRALNRAWK